MTGVEVVRRTTLHRTALVMTFAYLIVLVLVAFWPTPIDRDARGLIGSLVGWLQGHGAPGWVRYRTIEFGANIALFVPVGLFITILAGAQRWWLGLFVGFAASCTIEFGQLVFLPARFATINDVVANTAGAAAGALLGVLVLLALSLGERDPLPRFRNDDDE
ncbi:MAG: VanZ family protein [Cryobacterium sp.]